MFKHSLHSQTDTFMLRREAEYN